MFGSDYEHLMQSSLHKSHSFVYEFSKNLSGQFGTQTFKFLSKYVFYLHFLQLLDKGPVHSRQISLHS